MERGVTRRRHATASAISALARAVLLAIAIVGLTGCQSLGHRPKLAPPPPLDSCRTAATMELVAYHVGAQSDRLLARASRLAPSSAMLVSLAARMLPSLERDARRLHEAAQLRGLDLSTGPKLRRARDAAALAVPLVGSSLESGLDVAEAMAARGFGSGGRTHVRERPWTGVEWAVFILGLGLGVVAGFAIAGAAPYSYFPLLDPVLTPAAVAMAGAACGLMGAAWWALRR